MVFESGLLHLADSAVSYRSVPAAVADLLRRVPVAWDETRCLAGEPGSHVVIARRSGPQWWVAGINGRAEPVTVELPDLAGSWLTVDDDLTATSGTAGPQTMAPYGGFLAVPRS